MAAKIKIARFGKDTQPLDRPPGHRAPGRQTGLYLLALRSHVTHAQHLVPGRKLVIPIEAAANGESAPEPVKINHT